mmetsp:Transcript_32869/g.36411  ORF Transcript_32869/g.36411 Transcript_32869/m.36411 type:complete len:220 (+) Transcript_32869:243-902(+)
MRWEWLLEACYVPGAVRVLEILVSSEGLESARVDFPAIESKNHGKEKRNRCTNPCHDPYTGIRFHYCVYGQIYATKATKQSTDDHHGHRDTVGETVGNLIETPLGELWKTYCYSEKALLGERWHIFRNFFKALLETLLFLLIFFKFLLETLLDTGRFGDAVRDGGVDAFLYLLYVAGAAVLGDRSPKTYLADKMIDRLVGFGLKQKSLGQLGKPKAADE